MDTPRSVLLVRFSSLGDILLTTPLIRALRTRWPEAHMAFLTKPEYAPLLEHNPHLTEVLTLPGSRFRDLRRLAHDLRTRSFDVVVDLHTSLRSWYMRGVGREQAVWRRDRLRRWRLIHLKQNWYSQPIVPLPERFFNALGRWDVEPDGNGLHGFCTDLGV